MSIKKEDLRIFLSKYLAQRYKILTYKKRLQEQKIKAENTVKAVTYDKEKVAPTNKITDLYVDIDKYIDDSNEYLMHINNYKEVNYYIYTQINKLKNKEHKHLLTQLYVKFKNFYEIKKTYKHQLDIYTDYEESLNELSKVFVLSKKIEEIIDF